MNYHTNQEPLKSYTDLHKDNQTLENYRSYLQKRKNQILQELQREEKQHDCNR